jgi:hypothetical protein
MRKIMFLFIVINTLPLMVYSLDNDSISLDKSYERDLNFYKSLNEMKDRFIVSQFKIDSLKNVELKMYRKNSQILRDSIVYSMLDKFNYIEDKRKKETKKLKLKNVILSISLSVSIIFISFTQ